MQSNRRFIPSALARVSLATVAAAAVIASAGAALANDCHTTPARITGITERNGPNCGANHSCGFIIVHWTGGKDCNHFNIRERAGHQFEAPGEDRGQLTNQRSAAWPQVRFGSNNTIHVSIQACTKPIFGSSHCTNFSPEVSHDVEPIAGKTDNRKEAACRTYATRAVTEAKFVRDNHCDPKVYSGPRWSLDFNEHLRWCVQAVPATANFEDRERMRLSKECRVGPPAGPKGGTPMITVRVRGQVFFINGSGFPPNAPVIVRITGPGAAIPAGLSALSITVNPSTKERIVANAQGGFSVALSGRQICKGAGRIVLTAEDQDRPEKGTATATCAR